MAKVIPPFPLTASPGSALLAKWYEDLRNLLNAGASWALLNFSGSNLTDIVTRNHNDLQNIQGGNPGEYYHLTNSQYLTATTVKTKAGAIVVGDIPLSTWAVYKDTSGGTLKLYANDGGVLKSVALV